jgi:hypothetical protein
LHIANGISMSICHDLPPVFALLFSV